MEEEKKKHDFGKGFLVGGLVGLGVGVAGTCVAAALMSDDEPEIEDQEDEQTEELETGNEKPGFISSVVKAAEEAGGTLSGNEETIFETDDNSSVGTDE
jgi:hypothetical protein